jgi:hypothetical protein
MAIKARVAISIAIMGPAMAAAHAARNPVEPDPAPAFLLKAAVLSGCLFHG